MTELQEVEQRLSKLIEDLVGSLQREMRQGFEQVNSRLDTQAARLERQGSLIQTGSRWTARMNEWSEKIDAALESRDRAIAELRDRIERLEKERPK